MNNFTDAQIKQAARKAARRYLQDDSANSTIKDVKIEGKDDEEASVCISWDYADRDPQDPPPDDMLFNVCVVEGGDGDELYVEGPEF